MNEATELNTLAQTDEANPLAALAANVSLSPLDVWTANARAAWIYGVVCGWGKTDLEAIARRFGWSRQQLERLATLRDQFVKLRAIFEVGLLSVLYHEAEGTAADDGHIRRALEAVTPPAILEAARREAADIVERDRR